MRGARLGHTNEWAPWGLKPGPTREKPTPRSARGRGGGKPGPTREKTMPRNPRRRIGGERGGGAAAGNQDQHARSQGQPTSSAPGGGKPGPTREEPRPRNPRAPGGGGGRETWTNTRGTKAKDPSRAPRRRETRTKFNTRGTKAKAKACSIKINYCYIAILLYCYIAILLYV